MSDKLRAFIAVPLDKSVQKTIASIQEQFQTLPVDIKWVNASQTHLTLQFLGDNDQKTADTISLMMKRKLSTFHAITSELSVLGAFPNTRQPSILWVGLNDTAGKLKNLADAVAHELQMLGFPKEARPFKAHITIGRVRTNKNIQALSEALLKIKVPAGITCPIARITLYKSTLTADGPIYDKISQTDLVD